MSYGVHQFERDGDIHFTYTCVVRKRRGKGKRVGVMKSEEGGGEEKEVNFMESEHEGIDGQRGRSCCSVDCCHEISFLPHYIYERKF